MYILWYKNKLHVIFTKIKKKNVASKRKISGQKQLTLLLLYYIINSVTFLSFNHRIQVLIQKWQIQVYEKECDLPKAK